MARAREARIVDRSARRSPLRRGQSPEQVDAQRTLRVRDQRPTIRRLPHTQCLDSRARRQATARDGLDSRRRLHDRIGRAVAVRRQRTRAARRHRRRHHQLSPRAAGLLAPGRCNQRQDSVKRQRRDARPSRGTRVGPRQHRRVRRRPRQRHHLRRIGRRHECRYAARYARGARPVPQSDTAERRQPYGRHRRARQPHG